MISQNARDPRTVLAREKYFSLRPQPLEQWLWRQGIAPSSERVFWLHWQEGMRGLDWCSEIPLRRVAQLCQLDVSTVTRAYQQLIGLGLIRRADPGRDPANPFHQATAVTEVRVPRELLLELDRYANRPGNRPSAELATAAPSPEPVAQGSKNVLEPALLDPFSGLTLKHRLQALAKLTSLMSAAERRQFDEAQRLHLSAVAFDEGSRLNAEQRGRVLLWLQLCAQKPVSPPTAAKASVGGVPPVGPRKLTVFELARLRRDLRSIVAPTVQAERLREIVWSIEEGALRRFQSLHAMRIALKKVRDGLWSRPNRMPPNWARVLGSKESADAAFPQTCRTA